MAGFISPSLNFASTIGAGLGGAARQANQLFAEDRAQSRQDDILNDAWAQRFDTNAKQYQEQKKQLRDESQLRDQLKQAAGGNEYIADSVMSAFRFSKEKDFGKALAQAAELKNQGLSGPNDYKSPFASNQQSDADAAYGNVQNSYNRLNPRNRGNVTLPDRYGSPQTGAAQDTYSPGAIQAQPITQPPGMPSQPYNNPQRGPSGLINENNDNGMYGQITKAPPVGTSIPLDSPSLGVSNSSNPTTQPNPYAVLGGTPKTNPIIQDIVGKVNIDTIDPSNRAAWQKSVQDAYKTGDANKLRTDLLPVTNTSKLDPTIQTQIAEVAKNAAIMSPEDRTAFNNSVKQAQQTGDVSRVRWDLAPSQADINSSANSKEAGKKATDVYVGDLIKRTNALESASQLARGADDIIRMATSDQPLQAGALQPFVDNVNRYFNALGVDLTQFGLKANRINDVNELKKVMGDMTFNQISQYHLGRWTNYEVGILKDKLPSVETDRNSMIKISLLFKNAAQKEIEAAGKESATAFGPNGEQFGSPNPKDVGKAMMLGRQSRSETRPPWVEVDARKPEEAQKILTNVPKGTWFEDVNSGRMYMRQ